MTTERMKDGIKKRGQIYYQVIRTVDPTNGREKPKWVRDALTRAATVAMRDKARVSLHDTEPGSHRRRTALTCDDSGGAGGARTHDPRIMSPLL